MLLYDLLKLHADSTEFTFRLFINGLTFDFLIDNIPFKFIHKKIVMWELAYHENPPLYDTEVLLFKVWLEGEENESEV